MNKMLIPIFDLDDTLYCEHDYVRSGFKAVAEFIADQKSTVNSVQIYEDFINAWLKDGRGSVFDIVCEKYDIEFDIARLVQVYREHVPLIQLYDDAKQIISFLKTKKIPMGLITDGDSTVQWRKIQSLHLKELLNVIIVTNDLGFENWKPSPIPYLKAVEELGVPIDQCVYIGDNPNKDFITARKLGMQTIRIVRSTGDHMKTKLTDVYEADKAIYTLTELFEDWG